jgi:hypothetical protein
MKNYKEQWIELYDLAVADGMPPVDAGEYASVEIGALYSDKIELVRDPAKDRRTHEPQHY